MGKRKYLPLTTAWIAATLETDTTILNALNTFEASMIANGMNSGDLIAYYPMVGGNSTKHSYNFMNTALYPLSFGGGWTHSATGALPSGTNGFANTGINASTVLTQNNSHLGFYSRTDTATASRVSIGAGSIPASRFHFMYLKNVGNAYAFNTSNVATQFATAANANSQGFYLSNKTSAAIGGLTLDKNGTQIAANTVAIAANNYPNINIFISTYNGLAEFDNKECAGATVGMGLNATKRGQLEDMVNALNTSLSRNVY
jgi:hypothetical protein